jgi:anaerobic magnesium-protoporphyrin IX monomethyl ester cyclase
MSYPDTALELNDTSDIDVPLNSMNCGTESTKLGTPIEPTKDFRKKNIEEFHPSLALSSLAAFIETYFKIHFTLNIYDMNLHAWTHRAENSLLDSGFLELTKEQIHSYDFNVLAISCQFQIHQRWVDEIISWLPNSRSENATIVGGGFASVFPEEAIRNDGVDYAVIGEGEHTFVHILNRICGHSDPQFEKEWPFDGYAIRSSNGKCFVEPKKIFLSNLASIPPPNWNIPGLEEHVLKYPDTRFPFMATRGCPMQCSFCNTDQQWGKRVRTRTVQHVVDELKQAYDQFHIKNFHCVDDNILVQHKWALDLFREISNQLSKDINISFSNFDLRFLKDEILDALKDIGVKQITIATETGTETNQRRISKYLKLDRVRDTVQRIRAKGFVIHNCFILGFPGETLSEILSTIDFARDLRTDSVQIHALQPYRGTAAFNDAVALGVIDEMYGEDPESLQWHTGQLSGEGWDAELIEQMAYDAGIELNFLATPLWDTLAGQNLLVEKMDRFIKVLPGHVIVYINRGYLSKILHNNIRQRDEFYQSALNNLIGDDPTFKRYLQWDFPQIKDFLAWVTSTHSNFADQILLDDVTVLPPKMESQDSFISNDRHYL